MMEMYWEDDSTPLDTGRDQRIADGLEVAALDQSEDDYASDASDGNIDYYNPQTKEFVPSKKKRGKVRAAGGVAPVSKPVTANYDSDDGRIIQLKQLGHSDEVVSSMLVDEGRIRYVPKTIGSRYQRLRRVVEDKEDERLDDELSDWHEGEDDKLMSIVKTMETKLARQIETLKLKMWKDVSGYLAGQLGGPKKYTHNACRERAEAIAAGVELPPIELDPDQDGRRKKREERIRAAKASRIAMADEAIELEAHKKAKTTERKRSIAEANQKRVAFQLNKIAEKKERIRIREERAANRELAKKIRLRTLNHMRIERDWQMEKNRREREIYKRIMGVDLNGKRLSRRGRERKNAHDSDEESNAIDDLESDEEEILLTDADEADDADEESDDDDIHPDLEASPPGDESVNIDNVGGTPAQVSADHKHSVSGRPKRNCQHRSSNVRLAKGAEPESDPVTGRKRKSPGLDSSERLSTPANTSTSPVGTGSPAKRKSSSNPFSVKDDSEALVTGTTLFNPRSVMTRSELDLLCFSRNIPQRSATEESYPELVARMNAIDRALDRHDLDDLLRSATEHTHGNRADKIERLQRFDVSKSIAGGMGINSRDLDHIRRYEGFTGEFRQLLDDAERATTHELQLDPDAASAAEPPAFADW